MDFNLTEEHRMAEKMVRDFCAKEVIPTIAEWDQKQEMAPHILPRMAELGILGINIPVKYGGQGFDYITLGLVCEELLLLQRAGLHQPGGRAREGQGAVGDRRDLRHDTALEAVEVQDASHRRGLPLR